MKIAKTALTAVAAPTALTLAHLVAIDGGITQEEVIKQIGEDSFKYFEGHRPTEGQGRNGYAKETMKDSQYERYQADRYWDYRASQGDKLGKVK